MKSSGSSSISRSSLSSSSSSTISSTIFTDGMVISIGMFSITAYWYIRNVVKKQKSVHETPFQRKRKQSLSDLSQRDNINEISVRGQSALLPAIPYLKQFLRCLQDPCDPIENRDGYIALCVAENRLIIRMLAERCMHNGTATAAFSDSTVYCYNSFLGYPIAREAAAYFLARRFLCIDEQILVSQPSIALAHIQPKHIALAAGAAAVLSNVFFLLGEPNIDCCLIPAPYYAAFDCDMNVIAGIVPFPVQQANQVLGPTENELDLAYMQAKSKGLNPKFLLITNPNNPLAVIYKPDVMKRAVNWARKRTMHTIVDEIYALSVHQKHGHSFQSIIRILNNDLGSDVHMVWALSKDFGASGLRYGILYTQNETLMEGFNTMGTFTGISGPIQYLFSEILTDDRFIDNFLDESRDLLIQSYTICTKKLDEMVLPFIPAEAGMFIYVDFSSLLPEKTFEYENKLSKLLYEIRIVLTPGESQHDTTPGMFRICYAWVSPSVLEIAMERLSRLVAKLRRMDWDDLSGRALESVIS